jgi:hypothetical protein
MNRILVAIAVIACFSFTAPTVPKKPVGWVMLGCFGSAQERNAKLYRALSATILVATGYETIDRPEQGQYCYKIALAYEPFQP